MTRTHPVLQLYSDRSTTRRYKAEPLAEGDLESIIAAGQRAPTGARGQIYSVVRITDPELRAELSELSGGQPHIIDAAEFLVFCVDLHRAQRLLEHRGGVFSVGPRVAVHYGTMDALLLAAYMVTAAEALGYGTCIVGGVLNRLDIVARTLRLPPGVLPIMGLTIGVPDADAAPTHSPRLPLRLVIHENACREPTAEDLDTAYQEMGDAWYGGLRRFFGLGGRLAKREQPWIRTLIQQGLEEKRGTDDD